MAAFIEGIVCHHQNLVTNLLGLPGHIVHETFRAPLAEWIEAVDQVPDGSGFVPGDARIRDGSGGYVLIILGDLKTES